MEKIKKNFSLKITLFITVFLAIIAAQLLLTVSLYFIDNAMMEQMNPKPDAFVYKGDTLVVINYGPIPSGDIEITDPPVYGTLVLMRSISPVAIYGLCLTIATILFYRIKLKAPLKILNEGVEKIGNKELDFNIASKSNDELGQLCDAFEIMRMELSQAFQALWASEENQKSLYRAFAHDLRTPLMVIKGNNELIEYVAAKNGNWDQAIQSVWASNDAIGRIERYANQLGELESIEEMPVNRKETDLGVFADKYRSQSKLVATNFEKEIEIICNGEGIISLDPDLVLRILDNIIMNGLEYSKSKVVLKFELNDNNLDISICDDGPGFSAEAIKHALNPFFSTNKAGGHMGIGLTVSQKLLNKMESALSIQNLTEGTEISFSLVV